MKKPGPIARRFSVAPIFMRERPRQRRHVAGQWHEQRRRRDSVASGATLGGTGSIGASVVTVDAGGFLAPGASIESLDVGGATINGTLAVEYQGVAGAGNDLIDLLNVAGGLDITNATLDFSDLGGTVDDGALIFAKYGSLTGTQFASVTGLLPANYTIDYAYNDGASSNNIALVQVPEPCSLGLAGVMLLGLCICHRRSAPKCGADEWK